VQEPAVSQSFIRVFVLVAVFLVSGAASAADIKLMTTGAFRPVAQDVIPNFEKQTGNKVTMVSDTAGGLMRRLSAGETFDVLVLTSDGIDALADLGTLNADSIAPLARVGIGVAVSLDATPPQLYSVEAFRDTLLKTRRVAYMDPRSGATSGKAVAAIFQALGIADQIRSRAPSDTVHIGPPTLLGVGVAAGDQGAQVPGVVIREALRGGPAQAAGLVDGDVLTTIDGAPLDSATALTQILDRHYPGDVIDLTWVDRSGQQRSGKATLGS